MFRKYPSLHLLHWKILLFVPSCSNSAQLGIGFEGAQKESGKSVLFEAPTGLTVNLSSVWFPPMSTWTGSNLA